MSERHVKLTCDDGTTIDLRWGRGAKFVLEVNEQPVGSSAGTAESEPVSPESPGSSTTLEQRRAYESVLSTDVFGGGR